MGKFKLQDDESDDDKDEVDVITPTCIVKRRPWRSHAFEQTVKSQPMSRDSVAYQNYDSLGGYYHEHEKEIPVSDCTFKPKSKTNWLMKSFLVVVLAWMCKKYHYDTIAPWMDHAKYHAWCFSADVWDMSLNLVHQANNAWIMAQAYYHQCNINTNTNTNTTNAAYLLPQEMGNHSSVEQWITQQCGLVGQDKAVSILVEHLRVASLPIDPHWLVFAGPHGVGKTHLAHCMAHLILDHYYQQQNSCNFIKPNQIQSHINNHFKVLHGQDFAEEYSSNNLMQQIVDFLRHCQRQSWDPLCVVLITGMQSLSTETLARLARASARMDNSISYHDTVRRRHLSASTKNTMFLFTTDLGSNVIFKSLIQKSSITTSTSTLNSTTALVRQAIESHYYTTGSPNHKTLLPTLTTVVPMMPLTPKHLHQIVNHTLGTDFHNQYQGVYWQQFIMTIEAQRQLVSPQMVDYVDLASLVFAQHGAHPLERATTQLKAKILRHVRQQCVTKESVQDALALQQQQEKIVSLPFVLIDYEKDEFALYCCKQSCLKEQSECMKHSCSRLIVSN